MVQSNWRYQIIKIENKRYCVFCLLTVFLVLVLILIREGLVCLGPHRDLVLVGFICLGQANQGILVKMILDPRLLKEVFFFWSINVRNVSLQYFYIPSFNITKNPLFALNWTHFTFYQLALKFCLILR